MTRIIVDTSAWIEYFEGTEKGARISEYVRESMLLITGMIATEICSKFMREQKPVEAVVMALRSLAALVPIDFEVAYQAAHIYNHQRKRKPKFGIVDAHIVAVAKINNAKVLTCDSDFLGLDEAIVVR